MGFHFSTKPKRIVLELDQLPDEVRENFRKFNILCVLKEQRKETVFAELVEMMIDDNELELAKNWQDFAGLQAAMKEIGYTVNRTTFWNYRNEGKFEGLVKTDGVTTLYDVDGILATFKTEAT